MYKKHQIFCTIESYCLNLPLSPSFRLKSSLQILPPHIIFPPNSYLVWKSVRKNGPGSTLCKSFLIPQYTKIPAGSDRFLPQALENICLIVGSEFRRLYSLAPTSYLLRWCNARIAYWWVSLPVRIYDVFFGLAYCMYIRDEVLLDQQRDVVIVLWARCILPIWGASPRILHANPLPDSCWSVHCTNSGTLAYNWQNTPSPKYNDDICLLI